MDVYFSVFFRVIPWLLKIAFNKAGKERMNTISYKLPNDLQAAVENSLADWQQHNNTARLWDKDASLWSNRDEAQWLDWLTAVPVKAGCAGGTARVCQ